MKRIVSLLVAVVVIAVGFAAPAAAWDSGNADGTQTVISGDNTAVCAVRDTGVVYCWGWNSSGQLGRGNTSPTATVAPVSTGAASSALSVSVGGATVCALLVNRTVQCWGYGSTGKVGIGTAPASVSMPTAVPGLANVANVQVGSDLVCAVKQDGTVWCWGTSPWAPFAGFPAAQQNSPVKVAGLANIVDVSQDGTNGCALRIDHRVLCWGNNDYGQLGDGTDSPRTGAVLVAGITDATAVTVGSSSACAIRAGGAVSCWGSNQYGALGGRSTVVEAKTPVPVFGLSGVTSLGEAPWGACAVTGGVVKCWGANDQGRLGDGQFLNVYSPTRSAAAGLANPTSVFSSHWNSCEIANGGRVWCWGYQSGGQLGAGSAPDPVAGEGTGPGNTFGFAADRAKVRIVNTATGKPAGSSASAHKIKITWTAPSTSGGMSAPTDYVVQYKLKGTSTWKTFKDAVSATRSATVTGLTSGKYYQFRVYPKNWAGTGSVSTASGYIKSK